MEARNNHNTRMTKKKGSCRISIVRWAWLSGYTPSHDCPGTHLQWLSGHTPSMIVRAHTFTALESVPPHIAWYAPSANPRTETIQDNVPHCLMGQRVSDTGRPGQKWWKSDFASLLLLFLWLLLTTGVVTKIVTVKKQSSHPLLWGLRSSDA